MSISEKIRSLAHEGLRTTDIARRLGIRYQHVYNVLKKTNGVSADSVDKAATVVAPITLKPFLYDQKEPTVSEMQITDVDVTRDWFWEGNVVEVIAQYLEREEWTLISKANTHSKERGVDIHAIKNDKVLLIEAKGYPSASYRDPRRANEKKPTNPTNQAQQWYSHALLKVLRLQTKYPEAIVALGLPDFPRYRKLFEETEIGLQKLGVALLAVSESGKVREWGFPDNGLFVFSAKD